MSLNGCHQKNSHESIDPSNYSLCNFNLNYSQFSNISTGSIISTGLQDSKSSLFNVPYDLNVKRLYCLISSLLCTFYYKYRGSPLYTVSVRADSHRAVFSGPPQHGQDGFYGTIWFQIVALKPINMEKVNRTLEF